MLNILYMILILYTIAGAFISIWGMCDYIDGDKIFYKNKYQMYIGNILSGPTGWTIAVLWCLAFTFKPVWDKIGELKDE